MVNVFINGRRYRTNARAQYFEDTKKVKVLKGTVVSETISDFSHHDIIKALREKVTNDEGILLQDVEFNSPTAAAEFVCGYSVSGPFAWRIDKTNRLSSLIK